MPTYFMDGHFRLAVLIDIGNRTRMYYVGKTSLYDVRHVLKVIISVRNQYGALVVYTLYTLGSKYLWSSISISDRTCFQEYVPSLYSPKLDAFKLIKNQKDLDDLDDSWHWKFTLKSDLGTFWLFVKVSESQIKTVFV